MPYIDPRKLSPHLVKCLGPVRPCTDLSNYPVVDFKRLPANPALEARHPGVTEVEIPCYASKRGKFTFANVPAEVYLAARPLLVGPTGLLKEHAIFVHFPGPNGEPGHYRKDTQHLPMPPMPPMPPTTSHVPPTQPEASPPPYTPDLDLHDAMAYLLVRVDTALRATEALATLRHIVEDAEEMTPETFRFLVVKTVKEATETA